MSLVVVSKVKKLVKQKSGLNTSADTAEVLSRKIEQWLDEGAANAKAAKRKTLMARDLE